MVAGNFGMCDEPGSQRGIASKWQRIDCAFNNVGESESELRRLRFGRYFAVRVDCDEPLSLTVTFFDCYIRCSGTTRMSHLYASPSSSPA